METDYFEIINKAFRAILPSLAEFVGSTLKEKDNKNWWKNYVIEKLSETSIRNLPKEGSYEECIKSLDILACLNIIIANWLDIFKCKFKNEQKYLTYAHEIRDIRHDLAHTKPETTFSDDDTKRALNTIELFMAPIDSKIPEKINPLIKSQIETTEIPKTKIHVVNLPTPSNKGNGINKKPKDIKFVGKCVIIKTKSEIIKERGGIYAAIRCFWPEGYMEKAEKADYVLAVVRGENRVKDVFKPTAWYYTTDENENMKKYGVKDYYKDKYKGRIFFVGEIADNEIRDRYLNIKLPKEFQCMSSFQYSW